ncbi:hypothetical protein HGA88_00390 [Candidatus Roizmanbacteria bacterium]|nr:hypothetical protein [Candidatus Roizmanbacteria bacterium]
MESDNWCKRKYLILLKKWIAFVLFANILLSTIFPSFSLNAPLFNKINKQVQAASLNLTKTSQADWLAGKFEFNEIDATSSANSIKLQKDLGTWVASEPASLNQYMASNLKTIKIAKFLYTYRNNAIGQFMRYDMGTREWKEMGYLPHQAYEVLDMTTNGTDTIWAFASRGSSGISYKQFLKYDIPTNTWSYMKNPPNTLGTWSALEYVGPDYIYAVRGGSYESWRYKISTDTWESLPNQMYCESYCDLVYDGSRYIYMNSSWQNPDRFYRLDLTNLTWTQMANAPMDNAFYYANDMVLYNGDIYTMRGGGTNTFYKYSISGNTWTQAANIPINVNYGTLIADPDNNRLIMSGEFGDFRYYYPSSNTWSSLVNGPPANSLYGGKAWASDGNGNFYFCRGQNTSTCYKYVLATNVWTTLSSAPVSLGNEGVSLIFTGGFLYVGRGNNGGEFYQYNPTNDTWTAKANTLAAFGQGGTMVASDSASIFMLRGAGASNLYKYDIAGNAWVAKASMPEGEYIGGGLVKAGSFLYGLQGNYRSRFFRYTETTNTWNELASLPVGSYHGGAITYDGGDYIYATVGGDVDLWGRQMYRYSISANRWTRMADAPNIFRNGGSIDWYNGAIYAYQGYTLNLWKYVPPTGSTPYVSQGTWFSPVYDLQYVSSWNSFSKNATIPADTSVSYYSRTSDNQNVWDDWQEITGSTVPSASKRYIQIKIVLKGNGSVSPQVDDFSIGYNSDETAPNISTVVVTGSSEKGSATPLVSGQTYGYRSPYFQWTSGSDVGTGIDGYYVYFGTNSGADPQTEGNYQTGRDYVTNYPFQNGGVYYLIIKAKDRSGNISGAITGFQYSYSGISATASIGMNKRSDWESPQATRSGIFSGTSAWWNRAYGYRKQVSIVGGLNGVQPTQWIQLTDDTTALASANKLRTDRKDWRIFYWTGSIWEELKRDYAATNSTYFHPYKTIPAGQTDSNYYIYYGNPNESTIPATLSFLGDGEYSPDAFGYIRDILFLGTFGSQYDTDYLGGEANIDANLGENLAGKTWIKWADSDSYVDFNALLSPTSNSTGYVFARIYSPVTQTVQFRFGSDDRGKVWLNGNLIHSDATTHGASVDQFIVNTSLQQGNNRLLIKITQGTGSTGYYGRFTTPGGVPITNLGINISAVPVSSGGTEELVSSDDSAASISLQQMSTGSWSGAQTTSSLPFASRMEYGAAVYVNTNLYVLRGNNGRAFYKQDVSTGVWTPLSDIPNTVYAGAAMVFDGIDTIYAMRGSSSTDFYKYSISTNVWSTASVVPKSVGSGGALVRVGTDSIYAFSGNSNGDFFRYSINSDTWVSLSSSPWGPTGGSGLVYTGGDYIYAVLGQQGNFTRYSISNNAWDYTLQFMPYYNGPSNQNLVYDGGNYLYTFTSYVYNAPDDTRRYIWRYNLTTLMWENVPTQTDFWMWTGAAAYDGSRYVYLIQGWNTNGGSTATARYDLQTNTFTPETPPLPINKTYYNNGEHFNSQASTATSLVSDGSDIVYYLQGGGGIVEQYQISTKKWTRLPNAPCTIYSGSVYANGAVYFACGNNTTLFFRYDSASLSWVRLADVPATVSAAGAQVASFDGTDTIYLLRGNGTTTLYKYTISTNTWATESTTAPISFGGGWGATMIYDGAGTTGNLYITRGNGWGNFYKYSLQSHTWSSLNSVPVPPNSGAATIYDNGKIYYIPGASTNRMFVYDVTSNQWVNGTKTPGETDYGASMVKVGNVAYVTQGNYTSTFWRFVLPSATTAYTNQGSYISRSYDLGNPYAWSDLTATVSTPSGTFVTFETRTSSDAVHWTPWVQTSDLKVAGSHFTSAINSSTARYIQIKTNLFSNENIATPTISDISLHYYNDIVPPSNPNVLTSYETSTKAATLQTDKWYNKTKPYFEWSGAADEASGSGLAGYYVYFGPDKNADASSSGTFQTTASYTANLSKDGEYYLIIQAKDNSGNINPVNWKAFHYRFDITPPKAPVSVAADPRNYTSINNFTMFWLSTDDVLSQGTASGLLEYHYKTGSSSANLQEYATTNTVVAGIPAYQSGVNTFYICSADLAGNESDCATANYYYNGSAPSPPRNLTVIPDYSVENKFSFSWDEPGFFKGSIKEYRYSVNALPSATNYASVMNRYLAPNSYATVKGKNIMYIVAVDEADNVNYNAYASVEFTADTAAPGIPINPEVFDNSIRSTKQYKVGLTWDAPANLGTGFAGYSIYGSDVAKDCESDFSSYQLAGSTAGTTYVVSSLGGKPLDSKTYYFCIKAYDSTNQYSPVSKTVSLWPTGRWLSAADMVSSSSATVKTKSASVSWSTSRASNSFVKYGTKSGDYGNEVGSSEQVVAHTIAITGLNPGTTYYYKTIWTDEDGNMGSSNELSFTTNPAPFISDVKVSDISLYTGLVTFKVKNATKISVQYGKTLSYGSTINHVTSKDESINTIRIDSLLDGTQYHLRVVAEDEEGNSFAGDDYTFETLPVPKITGLRVQQVSGLPTATLRLLWTSNAPISSIVTYYPSSVPELAKDQISLALTKTHQMVLKDLRDDMEYTIEIRGKDSAGNTADYPFQKVKTALDFRPPEIQNMSVESTIVGIGDQAKAQIIVSWDTDEPATTQVEYAQGTGETYGQTTQEDLNLTQNHTVTISGLSPQKIYHLRAISKDKSNNGAKSEDSVIITPKSTKDALNIVVDNLSKTFGFLKNISFGK